MKKIIFFAIMSLLLVACNKNEPQKVHIGVWEPVDSGVDLFVITADSIKAIQIDTKAEHYQCHYRIINDSVAELERSWLKEYLNLPPSDFHPEQYLHEEVKMYFDKEGYLIINPFWGGVLEQIYPNYAILKLKRHTESK